MSNWIDPLAEKLDGEARISYLEIKTSTRKALVDGLSGVKRWSTTPFKMDPDWKENNLDHVLELVDWAGQLGRKSPALKAALCQGKAEHWKDLLAMLILHDIGEIAVGDICRSDPRFEQYHGRLHKRKESYAAHLMLGNGDLVGEESDLWRSLYQRFDNRDQTDRLVMLGHFLDKGQATQNVARHQILFNLDNPDYSVARATEENLATSLGFMVEALGGLPGQKIKQELVDFAAEKIIQPFENLKLPKVEETLVEIRRQFADMSLTL